MYKFYSKILLNTIKNRHLLNSTRNFCTRFSKSHEWVKMLKKGNIATIGISSFSSGFIGKFNKIKLPTVNSHCKINEKIGIVGSPNSIKEVYAPISGKCIEINNELLKEPNLIVESPERRGWLVKIEVDNHEDFESLMTREEYQNFLNNGVDGVSKTIGEKIDSGTPGTIVLG
ncbi:hypothetical protein ACTFIZ_003867 [Dictyostelium cf. discoideum]